MSDLLDEIKELQAKIAGLENLRDVLGEDVVAQNIALTVKRFLHPLW